jgi:mannose-6-phosphate isomerase-like protein (cupin superfamily)
MAEPKWFIRNIAAVPPGVDHAIENTGLVDLVFLMVTSPVTDEVKG